MASTRGRQVVIPLTNKSGGSVAAGDVVIMDASNDTSFTTTTTSRYEGVVGIAQETIANNATGRVLIAGYAALVNVPASVTRGHYIETHTVAKQATGSSTRRSGSLGVFLTGGTTPTALLGGLPDQTASGASSILLASQAFTGGNESTSATSITDTSNLAITFTAPASGIVLVRYSGGASIGNTVFDIAQWGLRESTTTVHGPVNVVRCEEAGGAANILFASVVARISGISAGSHTYKVAHLVTGGGGSTSVIVAGAASPFVMEVWAA